MNMKEQSSESPLRLSSIDILRGLIMVLMTVVNYCGGLQGIPGTLKHAADDADTITVADMVVPGFLFVVGISIPLALSKRMARGDGVWMILNHIALRTAALLFLGVWWVNKSFYSEALTGMSRSWWYILGYLGVFLVWCVCPAPQSPTVRKWTFGLKIVGATLLVALMAIFRGTAPGGETVWLQTSWWGILGTIGWAYGFSAVAYLLCKGNPVSLLAVMGLTVAIYIGGKLGALAFLGEVGSFLEVGKNFGTKSTMVLAGAVAGICISGASLWREFAEKRTFLLTFGLIMLASGYLLRPLHTFSKLWCTESYALATAGFWCLVFLLFYWWIDRKGRSRGLAFLIPIGRNPLLLYFLPDLLNCVLNQFGIRKWVFPFCAAGGWAGFLNVLLVAALLCALTAWATRKRLILKL